MVYKVTEYRVTVYSVAVYRVTVYSILVYRVTVYSVVVYRVMVYRVTEHRVTVYSVAVYRVMVYSVVVYGVTVYSLVVYRVTVYSVVVYRVTVYRVAVYRVTVHSVTVYRVMVCSVAVYRVTVCSVAVYRVTVYSVAVYSISEACCPSAPVCSQACAPLWSQECGTSIFSTGICASVSNDLEPKEIIAPTAQRCTTYMDIVIVLDGSNSIYPWYEVQNFLSNILSKFHISPEQMQVGILQYGEISIHEWSLKDYQTTQDVVGAAKNISRQEGRETRTAYAIHMACTEAFSVERGAREGATKVMIVVTDGESHDGEELPEALAECEKRNITRYAIAVSPPRTIYTLHEHCPLVGGSKGGYPGHTLNDPSTLLMTLGTLLMTLGTLSMTLGTLLITLGTLSMTLGTLLMTLGTLLMTLGTLLMTLGTLLITLGTLSMTLGTLLMTLGTLSMTLGTLLMTLGTLSMTLGTLLMTLGTLSMTLGTLLITLGTLSMTLGTLLITLGTLSMTLGTLLMTLGTLSMTLGTLLITLGTLSMTLGTLLMTLGTLSMTLGTLLMTLGTLLITLGTLSMTLGTLLITLGTLSMTLGTLPNDPGHTLNDPGHTPDDPGHTLNDPGHTPDNPGHTLNDPGHTPDDPGHTLNDPGHTPDNPGHTLNDPGHTPDDPGHTLNDPGHTPDNPGHTLNDPGHTPDDPGHTLNDPGHTPDNPGHTLDDPGHTPDDPGHTLDDPGHTPDDPGHTLNDPGTLLITLGTLSMTLGTLLMTLGTLLITLGTLSMTLASRRQKPALHPRLPCDIKDFSLVVSCPEMSCSVSVGKRTVEVLASCVRTYLLSFSQRQLNSLFLMVLGHYIRRQQDPETFINEIKYIASDPDEKYFFNVTDEAALNDIVDALGDRIFSLEGTLGYNESAFLMEMSQIGFSTHILDDGILFGMVGAYDWEGGVLKESSGGTITPPREAFEKEFPLELKNHAAYLGYTVSSVTVGDWRKLYVAGAPRFKHKGKVILFDLSPDGDVTITQALAGEQIGSYFGSEVCGVDVDQDGITDILLIAAPMFLGAGNKETGKVYVYCLDGEGFAPNGTLHSQQKAQDARFGYAMAVASDLNHDGYADLLVGAPLEDDHQGALYIYHGDEYYIIPQYKQRVSASSLSTPLRYFGRSLCALFDMDGDELLDLAVGAQGGAILLRSCSIVQVNLSLTFQPSSINVIQKNCQRGSRESACLNATACFLALSRSPGSYGTYFDLQVGAMLDDRKLSARALFDSNSQRQTLTGVRVRVGDPFCHTLPFHVVDTADYIRPISFSLHFKINDTESGPVLDEGWPTTVKKYIPFYKDCGEDDVCVTDLVLQAHMDLSGSRQQPYVIRSPRRRLAVEVQLQNRLENAYNTSLTLHYSRNLHFSSLSIREDAQFKIECTPLSSNSRSCNISYPVFRSQSKVNFMLEFEFSCTSLVSKIQMKLVAASDSIEGENSDNTVQLQSIVQYEPDIFITSESNLNRYEVHPTRTLSEGTGPEFHTHFRVQNLGCYVVNNLDLHVSLPSIAAADRVFSSVVNAISHNISGINCSIKNDLAEMKAAQRDVRPLHPEDMKKNEVLNCSTAWCVEVVCQIQQLLKGETALIRITRRVHDNFFRQAKFKAVMIVGSYQLHSRETNLITLGNAAIWR
ncbi:hypothetical protein P4O66_010478, partial [Electrophorus voltai]